MMDFEEFKHSVMENIRNFLPEMYGGAGIALQEVTKNNDQRFTGLLIQTENSNVAPCIYLDQYYAQYQEGRDMDDILQAITDVRTANEAMDHFDADRIMDFEQARDKIICRLVNAETNGEYLSDKPHMQMDDLAVVYAVSLGILEGGRMSAAITDNIMESYGITAEELHEAALQNLSESAIEFKSMRDVMIEMMFPEGLSENDPRAAMLPPEESMPNIYVLTNADKVDGAAAVLDEKTMEGIAEKLGGDYVVIPSSIHEVLILPADTGMDRREIERMIQEVNDGAVAPEERLSDHAYQYDSLAHKLVRMDRMEERQAQRPEGRENAASEDRAEKKPEKERVSVKEKLAEKKAQSVKNTAGREKTLPARTKETAALE